MFGVPTDRQCEGERRLLHAKPTRVSAVEASEECESMPVSTYSAQVEQSRDYIQLATETILLYVTLGHGTVCFLVLVTYLYQGIGIFL